MAGQDNDPQRHVEPVGSLEELRAVFPDKRYRID